MSMPDASRKDPAADMERPARKLPYHFIWPLLAGVSTGLLFRFIFSGTGREPFGTMMVSFLFLAPLAVGVVTVYVAERSKRRSFAYYFWTPALANILFVAGALLINLEGAICAILIVPMFTVVGGIGGLVMGAICRWTKWPRQATYTFLLLPMLFGGLEQRLPLPRQVADVRRTVFIDAPASDVWQQIHHADGIRPEEVDSAWMYRIGVPVPHAGITVETPEGRVRKITMGKGIHFDQRITDWTPER
jgi:hypothetical protein